MSIEIPLDIAGLSLRQTNMEDARQLFFLINADRKHLGVFHRLPETTRHFESFEQEIRINDPHVSLVYCICFEQNGTSRIVGQVRIDRTYKVLIGYWLAYRYTRLGYATSAVKGMCSHVFSQTEKYGLTEEIHALVHSNNFPSQRVLTRAGFNISKDGSNADLLLFVRRND